MFCRTLAKTNYYLIKPLDIPKLDYKYYPNYKVYGFVVEPAEKLNDSAVRTVKRRKTLENVFKDENMQAIEKEIESQQSFFNTESQTTLVAVSHLKDKLESFNKTYKTPAKEPKPSIQAKDIKPALKAKEGLQIIIKKDKGPNFKSINLDEVDENALKRPSFAKNLGLLSHLSEDNRVPAEILITSDMTKKEKIMARIANAKRGSMPTTNQLLAFPKAKVKAIVSDAKIDNEKARKAEEKESGKKAGKVKK